MKSQDLNDDNKIDGEEDNVKKEKTRKSTNLTTSGKNKSVDQRIHRRKRKRNSKTMKTALFEEEEEKFAEDADNFYSRKKNIMNILMPLYFTDQNEIENKNKKYLNDTKQSSSEFLF